MLFRAERSGERTRGRSRGAREIALAGLSTIGGFTLAAFVTVACTAEDPGDVDTGNGPFPEPSTGTVGTTTSPTGSSSTGPVMGDGGTTQPGSEAGATPGTDASADSGPIHIIPLPALFDAAPPYDKSKIPLMTAASLAGTNHQFTDGTNPIGQDCSTCHFAGGSANKYPWLIGGSIVDDAGNGVPGAEVVMVAPDGGVVVTVYTDTDGNLWVLPIADSGSASVPEGAQMMVRKADGEDNYMSQKLTAATNVGCASGQCHGGNQGLPHVP